MIAALGKNRVIGKDNRLLWHIPDDLRRFKRLTMNHVVIMGRKTFESILLITRDPLPGRTKIVITRNWVYNDALAAPSVQDALYMAHGTEYHEIFVIGGARVYEQILPEADRLYLTLIDDEKDGDVFFPAYEKVFTRIVAEEAHTWKGISYRWVDLEKEEKESAGG
jgi:dihydrofolate reductase